jgi:transcriptional regulator GlxA family with amidase domain
MRQVTFWAYPQCIASGIAGPIDVLLTANVVWSMRRRRAGPLFSWRVASLRGEPVRTAAGVVLAADEVLGTGPIPDVLFMPGMAADGIEGLRRNIATLKPHLDFMLPLHQVGVTLAANCSASFLLAEAGLLDGRAATTHWSLANEFRARYPKACLQPGQILTEQDGVLCSGAATAYLDLALRIVEKFGGRELAADVAKLLLIDANRSAQMPRPGAALQDHFSAESDALVGKSLRWLKRNLHRPFSMAELAGHLCCSERTVSRRFAQAMGRSPGVYLQHMRIDEARRLLETTRHSVEAVCAKVGYADTHFFRRIFKRETGFTPRDYREQQVLRKTPSANK